MSLACIGTRISPARLRRFVGLRPQQRTEAVAGVTERARQVQLRQIVREDGIDQIEPRVGLSLLGLHYFDCIDDAGFHAGASHLQGFAGDIEILARDFHLSGGGFQIDNPNPAWDDPRAQLIQEMLDNQINPAVARHGGYVQLMDVQGDTVYVLLGGGCQGCGMVDVTLKQGIEVLIKEALPDIERVVDTTDHAGGTNPYYEPAKA